VIQLVFKGVSSTYSTTVGPATSFRFHGPGVHHGDTGELVAEHRNLGWELGGEHYVRFDCRGPAVLRFEGDGGAVSKPREPGTQIWAADGVMYMDGEPVAKFDEGTGRWQDIDTDVRWPVLVLAAP